MHCKPDTAGHKHTQKRSDFVIITRVAGELETTGSAELAAAKRTTIGTFTLVHGHFDGWLTSTYEMNMFRDRNKYWISQLP